MKAFRTLYLKELRSLLPFLLLIVVLTSVSLLDVALTKFPDQQTLATLFGHNFGDDGSIIILFFLTFALTQGLLMRERSENTLEFLDSLPSSRSLIFICKCAAGLSLLMIFPLGENALAFILHAISRHSSAPDLHLVFFAKSLLFDIWMTLVFFGIGLTFSFLGRFSLLALIFVGLWYGTFKEMQLPWIESIDPFANVYDNMLGNSLLLPWRALISQMAISILLTLLSWWGFTKLGTSSNRFTLWKNRLVLTLLALGVGIATVSWVVIKRRNIAATPHSFLPDAYVPDFPSWQTAQTTTESFTFIYPSNQLQQAGKLISTAESVHKQVTSFFKVAPNRSLVIDLTSQSPRHAGTAYWKRVRMNLSANSSITELEAILGHELTHIYISQLSNNKINERFNSTRFFHEGLASYLEYRLFRESSDLPKIRKLAAIAKVRNRIRFEQLVDSTKLSQTHAIELIYPFGELFIAAVVSHYGDSAPEKLIRAFAREGAPAKLNAMTLWEDTFQSCEYNLEEVIAVFYELLANEIKLHQTFINNLPSIRAEVVRQGILVGVKLSSSSGSAITELKTEQLICRFRSDKDTPENQYLSGHTDDNNTSWVLSSYFSGKTFWYQVGFQLPGLSAPVMSPWKRSSIPKQGSEN
ncbi:MAG: ABC transporter permease [Verrucomicrobiales bacterium]|nr:ABC transporter permease [Verrucomicrobiales bacterium]